jgi:redox-sensitive bicupin YhaK (pirin superfamily)
MAKHDGPVRIRNRHAASYAARLRPPYLGHDRDQLPLSAAGPARALLLGGEAFPEPILMWWTFVARARAEVEAAYRDWRSDSPRFGRVDSPLARIPTPGLPWARQRS